MEETTTDLSRFGRIASVIFLVLSLLLLTIICLIFLVAVPQFRLMFEMLGTELPPATTFLLSVPRIPVVLFCTAVATLLILKEYRVRNKKLVLRMNIVAFVVGFVLLMITGICLYLPILPGPMLG
jgi:type II secretory pathway component PulF